MFQMAAWQLERLGGESGAISKGWSRHAVDPPLIYLSRRQAPLSSSDLIHLRLLVRSVFIPCIADDRPADHALASRQYVRIGARLGISVHYGLS